MEDNFRQDFLHGVQRKYDQLHRYNPHLTHEEIDYLFLTTIAKWIKKLEDLNSDIRIASTNEEATIMYNYLQSLRLRMLPQVRGV